MLIGQVQEEHQGNAGDDQSRELIEGKFFFHQLGLIMVYAASEIWTRL